MKKLVHVITTISRGGAENQLLILAREQVFGGQDVTVVFLKDAPELLEDFQSAGVIVNKSCYEKNIFHQLMWMAKYFKNNDVIIHAHLPRAEILVAATSLKGSFIVTRHNSEKFFPKMPTSMSSFLSRMVTDRAKSVIAISNEVSLFLKKNKEISENTKIDIIKYGFDNKMLISQKNIIKSELGLTNSNIIVGTIGRIVPQKDYPTLLNAFAAFNSNVPHSKLIILGDGYLASEMKLLTTKLKLDKNVLWLGKKSKIQDYLNIMDMFVLSSIYEGFGLVLLEALSVGVPIVASNISAIPEVLGNDYPYLARVGDYSDFADKMMEIYQANADEITKLALLAKGRLALFNPKQMKEKVDSVYQFTLA